MPSTLGGQPPISVYLAHESHKMHVEFEASSAIVKGQACKLHTDGTVRGILAADAATIPVIGFAFHDAAIGQQVTLTCRGWLTLSTHSGAAITPGLAKTAGTHTDANTGQVLNAIVQATGVTDYQGWVLDTATGANELVRFIPR